ncbi:alpha/beta fold hydrolase [Nocardia macrotermitis]|uniref:Alpha/beta hydrolase n=1 Tax=Nocardia macrotermitis TaxID=2585198 RepID=A0A7K0D5S6_9NOCA|nr:alpha/beta hydrolase [Nocardia macrotermitis]MQY20911.1 hypothetical protein [Nocardia macrotermitis]
MILRNSTLIVLTTACVTAAGFTPAVADTGRLSGSIDLPCAASVLRQDAAWYLPPGTPRGLVWLQHGFARTATDVADLARTLSAAGYLVFTPTLPFLNAHGCTLQNLGDNTPFLDRVAQLFGTATDPTGPLATALAAAATRTGVTPPAIPHRYVFIGHSAGAEAVEYVAHRLHTTYPATWPNLRGLILLDPVKSFLGANTDTALTDLSPTPLPILTISGPPAPCNNFGTGTTALRTDLHRPLLGVRLTTGEHTDAEGPSTDLLAESLCGTPQPANTTTLQQLAVRWTTQYFAGTTDYLPRSPAPESAPFQVLTGT